MLKLHVKKSDLWLLVQVLLAASFLAMNVMTLGYLMKQECVQGGTIFAKTILLKIVLNLGVFTCFIIISIKVLHAE